MSRPCRCITTYKKRIVVCASIRSNIFNTKSLSTSTGDQYVFQKGVRLPNTFWKHFQNKLAFMQAAEKKLEIKQPSDWYKVSQKEFKSLFGNSILTTYNSSLQSILQDIYPNYEWLPWKFDNCPRHYWNDLKNQRKFLNWVGNQLNIKEMSDWYKDITKLCRNALIVKYNCSLRNLLSAVYPEYEWLPWRFEYGIRKFWEKEENKKMFVSFVEKELKIKEMSDWYKVTLQDIVKIGGRGMLDQFNGSMYNMLVSMYPETNWDASKFIQKEWREVLKDFESKFKFVKQLETQLNIKNQEEWKQISKDHLKNVSLPPNWKISNLLSLVSEVYRSLKPKSLATKKSQFLLKSMLKTMFPNEDLLEEYRHPDIKSSTGFPLEFDFFFSNLNLAFEYQGIQHFKVSTSYHHNVESFEERKQKDFQKSEFCKSKGITLVQIPYWWDRKYESLFSTVYTLRPTLFQQIPMAMPIPDTEPTLPKKENVQKTALKKSLMLATLWEESMEPTGWIMTEKYDGVRLYWNGCEFFTREGNIITVPSSITLEMPPNIELDGELWTQYGLYQESALLCKKNIDVKKWEKAKFWVFDMPQMKTTFEERINALQNLKNEGKLPDFVHIVNAVKCTGKEHLQEFFSRVLERGGEGVMLRDPQSMYESGRSKGLRKFKPFQDTEVKVVENNYPHGLSCIQMNGKTIFVGLSDNYEEAKKLKEGDIITVKYQGTNIFGTLQYPKFYRERTDVKWNKN